MIQTAGLSMAMCQIWMVIHPWVGNWHWCSAWPCLHNASHNYCPDHDREQYELFSSSCISWSGFPLVVVGFSPRERSFSKIYFFTSLCSWLKPDLRSTLPHRLLWGMVVVVVDWVKLMYLPQNGKRERCLSCLQSKKSSTECKRTSFLCVMKRRKNNSSLILSLSLYTSA